MKAYRVSVLRPRLWMALSMAVMLVSGACSGAATSPSPSSAPPASTSAAPASTSAAPASTSAAPATSSGPYKIGEVFALTGAVAANGIQDNRGVQLAVEQINQAGGVNGRQLQLILKDDQSSADTAVTETTQLITQDHVAAIIGGAFGTTANAMGPVTLRYNVPFLTPTGMTTTAQESLTNTFFFVPKITNFATRMLDVIKALGKTKLGLLRLSREYGQWGSDTFHADDASYGVTLVAEEQGADADTDFTSQLTKIMGAKPDVLVLWFANPAGAIALKNARQLGITVPIIAPSSMATSPLLKIAGSAADGLYIETADTPDAPLPRQQAYNQAYQAKYNSVTQGLDAQAYDIPNVLAKALAKLPSGTVDGPQLIAALETISWQGAGSIGAFTKTNHEVDPSSLLICQIKNGKFLLADIPGING